MQLQPAQALAKLQSRNELFIELFKHGTLTVEFYKPTGTDNQQPHEQDEIYVIIAGSGEFLNGETTTTFQTGDLLFVSAGTEHRFLNFSDDFSTWVIFYGPKGGENPL